MSKGMVEAAVKAEAASAPKLVVRLGRGRTGGTTGLDWMVQRAGREVIIADAARNPTLSRLYPGRATSPPTAEVADVKDWLMSSVLDPMVEKNQSAVLDLGGGQDGTLSDFVRDLDLMGFCAGMGVVPVAVYFLGPEQDDFDHALAIHRAGFFTPKQTLLVLNEGVLKRGQTPAGAFARLMGATAFRDWVEVDGARAIFMNHLPCMDTLRMLQMTFADAKANRPNAAGERLGPSRAWQVTSWLDAMEAEVERVGAKAWLP